jgi:regulator of replication initiation timing
MRNLVVLFMLLLSATVSSAQDISCTDICFPTLNSSLYQGIYFSNHRWEKKDITVSFHNGDAFVQGKVKQYAKEWSSHCNINFVFVNNKDADIRVGFYAGKGSWSLIGKQSTEFSVDVNTGSPVPGRNGISMNFGWFNSKTTDIEFKRTTLHEFGHALCLLHEHMHPSSGINWNKPKVYAYYMQSQNWSKEQVDRNVFQKYSVAQSNSNYDPASIMHYPVSKDFTLDGYEVGFNYELSKGDRALVNEIYPKTSNPTVVTNKPSLRNRITSLVYGDGVWALTMSKMDTQKDEVWRTRLKFPEKEISELWAKGYHISNLSYGNGLWALVMKEGMGYADQVWRTRTNFPEKEIAELWAQGYYITNLTYGEDRWVLVMSKGGQMTNQIWRTRTNFPEKEIAEFWKQDYYITGLEYCNGLWVLVMSKGLGYSTQAWRTRNYFPKDEIDELWGKGYSITNISYGNGLWTLVMTKGTGLATQSWRTRTLFPEKEIDELWKAK